MSRELARSEGSAPGSGIDIHPLEDEEFEAVCSHLPGRSRTQHEHRMAHQKAGRSFYLIAWVDGVPAGHVGILFPDHRQIEDRCEWGDVGIVSDLWVEPAFRGRGAGRALMQALEREAVRADLPGIGLDTGLHEGYDAARALYRSLGYVDKGGVFIQSAALPADSVLPSFFEILTIWMKPLPQVRRLRLAEVDRLQAGMPSWNASEYAKRFAAQVRGELVQVVAWLGDEPIGRGMVLFSDHEEYSTSAERERCAEVRDVAVERSHQGRGVGGAIVRALERAVRDRGCGRIGMSVGADEGYAAARSVYAGLGYRHAHGPFVSSTNLFDDAGGPIPVGGVLDYLVKDL